MDPCEERFERLVNEGDVAAEPAVSRLTRLWVAMHKVHTPEAVTQLARNKPVKVGVSVGIIGLLLGGFAWWRKKR